MIIKDLGAVTAYAAAVEKGYTGTEEEFATLMASYATVAEEAAESAESASASATSAGASASTATQKASEASTAAQTATAKAEEAQADADAAALDASQALSAASTATTKASEAAQSASDATTAKTAAQTAQTAAEGSATTAQTAAQTATQKAAEAAESARTLTIDPTLSQSGQAADAKTTGDVINEVKADLDDSVNDLNSAFENHEDYATSKIGSPGIDITSLSGYDTVQGALASSGNWNNINSNYVHTIIPIPATGCHLTMTLGANSPADLNYAGVSEYTTPVDGQSFHATSSFGRKSISKGTTDKVVNWNLPDDVKYLLVMTVWGGNNPTISNFAITKAGVTGEIEGDIAQLQKDVTYYGKNLVNPSEIENGYISAYGAIFASDSYKTTGYIAIENGEKIAISPKARQMCVFDTSKEYIVEKFVDLESYTTGYVYTPTNDGFVRITFYVEDETSFMVEYGDEITSYEPYSAPVVVTEKVKELDNDVAELNAKVNKNGIKMLILGDSYSAVTNRYIDYLQAHMDITDLVNLGVSSAHLKDIYADRTTYPYDGRPYNGGTGNNNTLGNQIAKLERLMTGTDLDEGETQIYTTTAEYPDIILIEGGKNDTADANTENYEDEMWEKVNAYSYVSGGSVSLIDTYLPIPYADTDRTNFAGAMHYLYGALRAKFPNAKIFFITPSGINYSNANHTLYMVKADQMRAAARYLCTPTIDWDLEGRLSYVDNRVLGSGTQEDPYTRNASSQYTVDSLHPNWRGGELLGAVVCAKLRMYGLIN